MQRVDVVVVGGGPAGAAAAITLARAGRTVTVVDKARFPRDKCCGDGLTAEALRRLAHLGVDPGAVPSWTDVGAAWLRSPHGSEHCFPLPGPAGFAAVARREELDQAILHQARTEGAKVEEGVTITSLTVDQSDGVVRLGSASGWHAAATYVIGADGMWSTVRKLTDASDEPGYLGEWHGFRQYFTGVTGSARDRLWVWFEADLLPGYAWSFPLGDGRANVGYGIRRKAGVATKAMKEQWLDVLRRPHIAAALGPEAVAEAAHKAWPIPARVGATRLSAAGGRVLFAGDAARATDPLTGEGIGQALQTGEWAARAIIDSGPADPDAAVRRYQRMVERNLAVDHRLAATLSKMMATPAVASAAIKAAGATAWTRRNFGRWLFEDYPRAVLATPRRFGALRGSRSPFA